ncbi:hypothetical protein G6O69_11540 [Pseudenhygromyxa sp. WMMC2535]|uniref:hypothetical protein n=1 Tax=Pseudenhygromyxa sp. WMMC2535 TaxID=2712867 RepID=UPI001553FDDE|nr:hypothetical protein [Pseudenhygromyxa sp. WMMC2535]NVB38466.1 hypothetical protein [Pseudenhygromyxa sp. WMMC2535]
MSERPDLSHYVQHRQLEVYEQHMARQGYAYGVDLRRSNWLASSTIGNAMVRTVDRAWPGLSRRLLEEALLPGDAASVGLLREIGLHVEALRAPTPTLRVLRPGQRGRWPLVTALGATRGTAHWLIIDAEALAALPEAKRAFLLGAGLGHLHCDHAVFFTAHYLLAGGGEGEPGDGASARAMRALLAPWTKVMIFSADRAGLLSCGDLEAAVDTILSPPVPVGEDSADPSPAWLPRFPDTAARERALREFARSAVFARVLALRARRAELLRQLTSAAASPPETGEPGEPEPIHVPADAWTLARVDSRLTRRLALL